MAFVLKRNLEVWKRRLIKQRYRWETSPSSFIRRHRLAHVRMIRKPLLFVSQLQRSGGTLMGRLLDGHPELHAHPPELGIGRPDKSHWPALDLSASPAKWFYDLRENAVLVHAATGQVKGRKLQKLPFIFSQSLQREIFLKVADEMRPKTQREILDCYVTSYFNAWIDYQGLYRDPMTIKYWSVFTAKLAVYPDRCARIFADYPDGHLISLVRNPVSWFVSARRHDHAKYGDIEVATGLWRKSTEAYLENLESFPDRVTLVNFDELVANTSGVMRAICAKVGLKYDESLTRPTLNGLPVVANSSFKIKDPGKILTDVISRAGELTGDEAGFIKSRTDDLYERVSSRVVGA